jgi:hypothetical protein
MKHIKLFENFSPVNPVITATGDFSKLTLDGTPLEFIHPNTFMVTYHTNPSPDMIEKANEGFMGEDITIDPEQAIDDIMGGDQGGSYINKDDGIVIFPADSSYSPEDYKNVLQKAIDEFNEDPGAFESDTCQSLLEDPDLVLTPEFLSHCKALVSGSTMSQKYISKYPEYYKVHPEILPGGDRSRLKIMNPRITLIFKVV